MKKGLHAIGLCLAASVLMLSLSGCGSSKNASGGNAGAQGKSKDTITALLPPVTDTSATRYPQEKADFQKANPNVTLNFQSASWDDYDNKLSVEVNSGNPPDIAFVGFGNLPAYKTTGTLVDISKYATSSMINDFDASILDYAKIGSGLYGFPIYAEVHSIGGNKADMEAAGIDWQSIQKNGWTWEQFRQDIKKGVVKSGNNTTRYGLVFACAGVTEPDFWEILMNAGGIPSSFNSSNKFAWTDPKVLTILKNVREIIDDGSAPANMNSIDAGKRSNMFLTNQAMIYGKGMSTGEQNAQANNKALAKNDGSAVKGSTQIDYILLPMPSIGTGKSYVNIAVDTYSVFCNKSNMNNKTHLTNAVKVAYFLDSGKYAALTNADLFDAPITKSGREAAKEVKTDQSPYNMNLEDRLLKFAPPAQPNVSSALLQKSKKFEQQVILPKFQGLLANEVSPQQMYDSIKQEAVKEFGQNGIVS